MRHRETALISALLLVQAGPAVAQEPPSPEVTAPVFAGTQETQPPRQNVRLEIAVTAGSDATAPVFQVTHLIGTGRVHTLTAGQDVLMHGAFRPVGLSVERVEVSPQGKRLLVTAHLEVTLPPRGRPGASGPSDEALPPRLQHQFSVLLEGGQRTTVASALLPGVEEAVGVHLTATLLP